MISFGLLLFLTTVMCRRPLFKIETEAGIIGNRVESGDTCTRVNEPCGRIQFLSQGRFIVQDFPFHLLTAVQPRGYAKGFWNLETPDRFPNNTYLVFAVDRTTEIPHPLFTKVEIGEPRKIIYIVIPGGKLTHFEKVDDG